MKRFFVFICILYFLLRVFWVDKFIGKNNYFAVDYFEGINFLSNFVYNPEDYFHNVLLDNFNSVVIRLKSLNELKRDRLVDLADSNSLVTDRKPWLLFFDGRYNSKDVSFIYSPKYADLIESVIKDLKIKYERVGSVIIAQADSNYLFSLEVFYLDELRLDERRWDELRSGQIGPDNQLKKFSGKTIFWRVSSYVYDLDYLKNYCRSGDVVFFNGPFVAGYPDKLKMKEVSRFLRENGLVFAFPEYYDSKNVQLGVDFISGEKGIKTLKIFSTSVLQNKDIATIVNSVDLALNERNCSTVIFRFFYRYSLDQNLALIKDIKKDIFKDFVNGVNYSDSFFDKENVRWFINLSNWVFVIIISLWIFASYMHYYFIISNNNYNVSSSIFLFLGILNVFSLVLSKILSIDILFNLSVIIGLSFVIVSTFFDVFDSNSNIYVRYFKVLLYIVCIGIIGNALFFEPKYFLSLEKVRFIKVLLILPLLLSIFAVLDFNKLVLMFYRRLRVLDLFFVLFILAGVGFYLLRSGNSGLVLPFEDKFRYLLDKLFVARPRFKEFLIGNPAILASGYSFYFVPLSFISLSGIVNSFLHIHTPIFYSFLRTFWGGILGLVVFLIFYKIYDIIRRNSSRR